MWLIQGVKNQRKQERIRTTAVAEVSEAVSIHKDIVGGHSQVQYFFPWVLTNRWYMVQVYLEEINKCAIK